MNITELDSFNLADAVKFHDRLNPRLWDRSEHLKPEVHAKLMEIAKDFQEFLGVPDLDVKDITVSGSNAAYNYTSNSDIDLHLVVDLPEADNNEVYRELFDAKKFQYNAQHNIRIGGYDVELYVQNPNEEHHSQGIYSLLRNAWVSVPKRRKAEIDDISTRSKYEDLVARINSTIADGDHDSMANLMKKIKSMRQSGLETNGEFGADNLAFKLLRNNGYIKKLVDARNAARDAELSLDEARKKKQRVKYGFGGYWAPGFSFGDGDGGGDGGSGESKIYESPDGVDPTTKMFLEQPATESPDGVNPSTAMFLTEDDKETVVREFINFVADRLGISDMPEIVLHTDSEWSKQNKTFGRYTPETHRLEVNLANRHIMDILRTTAHELVHCRQNQEQELPGEAGRTGSRWENQAHAIAGVIMRDYADQNPVMFESSGYIPTAAEKNDPRFKMALSVDVRPGETGRQANKMALKTDAQGRPGLLMKSANLRESKIKLSTDPNWYGAEIGNYKASGPVINVDINKLVGFEPDSKKNQPKSKANIKKIISGLEKGDKLPPLLVRKYKKGYQVLDGHHRFWAYQSTGAKSIPVQVVPSSDIEELKEGRMPQPSQGQGKYRDLNEPMGPETPPTMPAGTVRVDVSDVYDWYKLGQHISNMKGLGKHDFGSGPPSTIFSFGDEETEHRFIKDLEATGLDVTDIDPKDPKQPSGMRKIKTDPTYNVAEQALAESLLEELALFEEDLFEVKMTSKNLAQLAKAIPGATVGLEFEMIVPNTSSDYGGDMEPDYDQDQRVRDIDDCVSFFDDGDYNDRGTIRRLRSDMEEAYMEWKMEAIDEAWFGGSGFEFFEEYLDREDPFDAEEAEEEARNELQAQYGDELDVEDFEKMLFELVDEKRRNYTQEQWDEQGRNYDDALDEFRDEQNDNYDEGDWLDSQGIRFASDVESNYDVTWPYWNSPETESDAKEVALNFMNAMGYDTIAVGDYHGYGGGYELWNGSEWVKIGSNKPMDAFTVEPDGSLSGDDSGDTGLEFVSPPIPLDQIGETMRKVQAWASENGVYTGKRNSTSLHTNISIPGYDLDKLDYLKAAILLGDEYVLRQFDRIGNTYAKPAINKVKELVKQKPEKAEELLNMMKSQLNAEASKLIHSGQTDKYTSINTKDNRIEFRSPGGDYLSDIANNPQKMQDTINRMVVVLDAAMDPNKYKEEYQKKLYKILTGQGGGREAKTGAKQEMKASDKDLLNIFTRYAAGELPKQALKSFVRQAQLERNVAKGKQSGKMWWSVTNPANSMASIEVVATNKDEAIAKAVEPGNYPEWARVLNTLQAKPLRPYQEPTRQSTGPSLNDRPSNPDGNYVIVDMTDETKPVYRFMASNDEDALLVQQQWSRANPGPAWRYKADPTQSLGQPVAQAQQTQTGNWGIWIRSANRFARAPGQTDNAVLRRFPGRDTALQWIEQARRENPNMRTDIEVREIEPAQQLARSRNALSQTDIENRLGWPDQIGDANYEVIDRRTQQPVFKFIANTDQDAARKYTQYLDVMMLPHETEDYGWRAISQPIPGSTLDLQRQRAAAAQTADAAQGGLIDVPIEIPDTAPRTLTTPGQSQQQFTGEWKVVDPEGRELYRFSGVGNAQSDANRVAIDWLRRNPGHLQAGVEVLPVMA